MNIKDGIGQYYCPPQLNMDPTLKRKPSLWLKFKFWLKDRKKK